MTDNLGSSAKGNLEGSWADQHGSHAVSTAEVLARISRLEEAVSAGGEYIDPHVAARARQELRLTKERLQAGLGLTVAALAGGTGSGKSSLFNTLTSLEFATVGDLRPTTQEPSACVWNAEAGVLLDMIGVPKHRRIAHDSILTAGTHDLDSLVLIDLPDHDSVNITHSAEVSRILPKVDVLIWVLDPQKYADHLIHESYLAAMRQRREQMIVVLNQIDAVPESRRQTLLDDVQRLLKKDGLAGVPVFATSANDLASLEPIRETLRRAVGDTEAALATAVAELEAIRGRVSAGVGDSEPVIDGENLAAVNDYLVTATGIPAVAESLRQSGYSLGKVAIAKPEQPSASTVVATRDAWMAHVKTGLPPLWQKAIDAAVPESEKIRRALGTKVRSIPVGAASRSMLWGLVLAFVLVAAGVALAALGIPSPEMPIRVGVAAVGIVLGICAAVIGRRRQIASGRAAAEKFESTAREAISTTTNELLVAPVGSVLERHRKAREGLAA
ncbi:GTPase [Actinomycetaceae bacterium L2_0104]